MPLPGEQVSADDIELVEIGNDYIVQRYVGQGQWSEATLTSRQKLDLHQMWHRHEREEQQFYERILESA